jgi:ubiquinone/menaquinone biosynthesis C-methylase UbiE
MLKPSYYQQAEYAARYDEDKYGGAFGAWLRKLEVDTFLSSLSADCRTVLDVGAGSGKLSLALALQSQQVVALDSSLEMLKVARQKLKEQGIELEAVVCDAQALCFVNDAFDGVVASRVLMHLSDWRRGIAELSRVAKQLIVDVPPTLGFGGLEGLYRRCRRWLAPETHTYRTFLTISLTQEVRKHDFQIVATKRQFFLPLAVHRRLDQPAVSMKLEAWCRRLGLTRLFGAPVTIRAVKVGSDTTPREGFYSNGQKR